MILKPLTDRRWKGYTLDEIQEQLVVNEARLMIQRQSLSKKIKLDEKSRAMNLKGTFTNILGYVDYIMLGVSLLRRIISLVKKRKNSSQQD